ncbi:HAD-like protein [Trametopsis cervina]|nr:HAD-like protein [Trametopsis cervina]
MPARTTSAIPKCTTLILDIGDVLCTWSLTTSTNVPTETLHTIRNSTTWGLYERGKLTQEECYRQITAENSIDLQELKDAFTHARDSLTVDHDFITFIRQLKSEATDNLHIFLMSNISQPDYDFLRTKEADWLVFDHIFTSFAAGMCKPNLCFYRLVLDTIGGDPGMVVFVDDKAENVLAARSLGMQGIVFEEKVTVQAKLRSLFCDPLKRGKQFLNSNAGKLDSVTSTGIVVPENFTQLLLLEVTKQEKLINITPPSLVGKWNFFKGKPILTTLEYPIDFDTTAVALTVLKYDIDVINAVMGEMLQFRDDDNIIETYFDRERRRTDPVVCVNVLSLFYSQRRGSELSATQAWVVDVLRYRAYLDGTRYYVTPESFLYFLSRLLETANDENLRQSCGPLLKERLQERIGAPGDAPALAMRIIACATSGIRDEVDMRRLAAMQREDGSWEPGMIYQYGKSGVGIGNQGLSTALALDAICMIEDTRRVDSLW